MFWIIFTLLSSLSLLYWYLTRNYNYWNEQGLSGPKPVPIFGNILSYFLTPMPILEIDWLKKYGKLYGVFAKNNPILTVAEPELIKVILVRDFHLFTDRKTRRVNHEILVKHLFQSTGDDWKRLRSIVSPTFTSGKMKKMYPIIKGCLNDFLDQLEAMALTKDSINVKEQFGNFTMDVIASCAFDTKTNAYTDQNNPFILNVRKVVAFDYIRMFMVTLLPTFVLKMVRVKSDRGVETSALEFFMDLTRHKLRERKLNAKKGEKFNDFIQLMADAEQDKDEALDENDMNEQHYINGKETLDVERKTFEINVTNKRLTEEEIMAQGYIFFVAGYETTATTLSFCAYELALNADVQQTLHEEIRTAADDEGDISYDVLAKLPYLDAVLSETLRMYPPVIRLERKVSTDYKLADTGIELKKGQEVEIPVYAIHHSEDFYPTPNRFMPERFLPENRHKIQPYTYLPFGSGPRNCIGMRFGLMEAKIGLAQVIRRYRFFRTGETAVPVVFTVGTRICTARKVMVGIEKRV